MVAINPKKYLHFGENPPEINLNSNLKRWFSRNIGLWKSNRTYFLDESQKTYNLSMNINIQALESKTCLLYTSPSPRDTEVSRMPSSA